MLIGWIVQSPGARIASTRYRALYPAVALERLGHRSRIYTNSLQACDDLQDLDAIVFVKRLDDAALRLIDAAALQGKGIFVDLCDNTVIIEYERRPSQLQRLWLGAASAMVDAVVVTTEAMTKAVSPAFLSGTRFEIIPDQIETIESYRGAEAFIDVNLVKPPKSSTAKSYVKILHHLWLTPGPTSKLIAKRLKQILARRTGSLFSRKSKRVSEAVPATNVPVLLWFGNHGSPHSNFGMLSLFQVAPALEKLAREFDFELWVISNDRMKYQSAIVPLRVRSRYFEWSPSMVFAALKKAAVCLFPSTGDDFSETKSANRVVMALQHGVPAIVSPLESLGSLNDALLVENWEENLRRILTDPDLARRQSDKAKPVLDRIYSAGAIGRQWDCLLRDARRSKVAFGPADPRIKAGILLDLVQDLDVLRPLIAAWREDPRFQLRVLVSDIGLARSPRMVRTFLELAVVPIVVERELALQGNDQSVRGLDVLVTASETTARAHRFNRQLTIAANADGVKTYTLQHGLENIGLTYFDAVTGPDITFASDRVLVWTAPENLPAWVSAQTRNKAVAVGRSAQVTRVDVDFPELSGRKVIGVFENLHWDRYTQSYRNQFVRDLLATAAALPEMLFLVKPHHAGKYLVKSGGLEGAGANIILADPNDPKWEPYTAAAVIPHCVGVITTPSTVALDATELGMPVAVVAYGEELEVYRPLVQIQNAAGWLSFIRMSQAEPGVALEKNELFRRRTRLDGDCIPRITDLVVADMAAVKVTTTLKR